MNQMKAGVVILLSDKGDSEQRRLPEAERAHDMMVGGEWVRLKGQHDRPLWLWNVLYLD